MNCAFFPKCEGTMKIMTGPAAAKAFLDVLMSPRFPLRNQLEGAANREVGDRVQKCDRCNFVAVFAP